MTGPQASGTVAALGEGVRGLAHGDEVAAYLPDGGGYAEYASAPAEFVFPLKEVGGGLDLRTAGAAPLVLTTAYGVPAGAGRIAAGDTVLVHAAAAPLVLTTAYGVLAGAGRIAAGDTVLVHAAAGGVGSVAAQLARSLGAAAVYGTVSTEEKAGYARRFGYDGVFLRDGSAEGVLAATSGRGVDLVLGPTRLVSFEALAPFGRVAVYGGAARHPDLHLPVLPVWKNNRGLTGYDIGDLSRRSPETLRRHTLAALGLVASGAVRTDITAEYDLADAPKAQEVLEAGRNTGEAVLRIGS